jgi:hypothetical protein
MIDLLQRTGPWHLQKRSRKKTTHWKKRGIPEYEKTRKDRVLNVK